MGDAHQEAARNTERSERQTGTVRGSAAGFAQEIVAGPHRLTSEPVSEGGEIRDFALRSAACGLGELYFIDGWSVRPSQEWPLEMVLRDLSPPNSAPSCWKLRINAPFIEH